MTINISVPTIEHDLKPKISVIGVGGAGGNAVNNMIRSNLEGVEFVVTNTDSQALGLSLADRKLQLGTNVTQGLGAGSRPDVGRAAAEEAIEEIMSEISQSNMVFITAGMGGGTGSGAAPVIAQAAREAGVLTIGVVTKPFHFEGQHRMRIADQGIEELTQFVDTLIIIPNQNLFRIANEKTTFAEAFTMADDVLHSGVRGVTDLMILPGLINLDFADIRTVMSEMGKAMMGSGEASGEDRAKAAAEAAINNPLLEDASMKGARGVLINITGGSDMTLFEVDEAANHIRDMVDTEANIIFGSALDEHMDGLIRVSVVATGIAADGMAVRPRPALSLVANRQKQAAAQQELATEATSVEAAPTAAEETLLEQAIAAVEQTEAPAQETLLVADEEFSNTPVAATEISAETAVQVPSGMITDVIADVAAEVRNQMGTQAEASQAPETDARQDDVFIAPPPAVPSPSPIETRKQPDPMRAADMANAGGQSSSERASSLIQRVTGLSFGKTTPPKPEAKLADQPEVSVKTTLDAPARPGIEPISATRPEPAPVQARVEPAPALDTAPETKTAEQQRLGSLDPRDRVHATPQEDDLLEIPAFLRRQAN